MLLVLLHTTPDALTFFSFCFCFFVFLFLFVVVVVFLFFFALDNDVVHSGISWLDSLTDCCSFPLQIS